MKTNRNSKSDFVLSLLMERVLVTCDGVIVNITPDESNSYGYNVASRCGTVNLYTNRDTLMQMCESGTLKFYQEVNVDSDFQSALWDHD